MASNWADLPIALLGKILNKLCIISIDSFKLVCRSWHSAFIEETSLNLLHPISSPMWIAIASSTTSDDDDESASFYNLTTGLFSRIQTSKNVAWHPPRREEAVCIGSSHGWLTFIDHNCGIYLENPFKSSLVIKLPSIETLPVVHPDVGAEILSDNYFNYEDRYRGEVNRFQSKRVYNSFVPKLVMSCAPDKSSSECTVMIIFGYSWETAFCKVGDKSWTLLDGQLRCLTDLYYCSNDRRFYACDGQGSIETWDLTDSSSPKSTCIVTPEFFSWLSINEHLTRFQSDFVRQNIAALNDDLYLVLRYHVSQETFDNRFFYGAMCSLNTIGTDIYKLDREKTEWRQVTRLGDGDDVLFLGINNAMNYSAAKFSELKSNSIYFNDDSLRFYGVIDDQYWYGGHYLGVFGVEADTFEPCNYPRDTLPIWISPNPW